MSSDYDVVISRVLKDDLPAPVGFQPGIRRGCFQAFEVNFWIEMAVEVDIQVNTSC